MSLLAENIFFFLHPGFLLVFTVGQRRKTDTGVGSLKSILPLRKNSGREGEIQVLILNEVTL